MTRTTLDHSDELQGLLEEFEVYRLRVNVALAADAARERRR